MSALFIAVTNVVQLLDDMGHALQKKKKKKALSSTSQLTGSRYPDTGPNPANESYLPNGTWDKPEMCGAYKPTNVISVSYGLGENQFSYFYWNRQCQEYMKLGLQGVSVVYSSGDSGVSNRGLCIYPSNVTNYTEIAEYPGAFSPSFPASCPYLTAVGATMVSLAL
jgi:tripeptidyl-peptidase I